LDFSLIQGEKETIGGFLFALLFSFVVFGIAQKNGFFSLPPARKENPVTFPSLLGIFLCYLLFAFVVLPLLSLLILAFITGEMGGLKAHLHPWAGWLQLVWLLVLFLILIAYCFLIPSSVRRFVFWGDRQTTFLNFFKGVGMGIVGWLVSYPFVLLMSILTNWIGKKLWGITHMEQVAVKQLKVTMNDPLLFAFMAIAVTILVPFMEELLFRGFFQNYVKRFLGRLGGIILTAVIFAAVHFSISQGYGNFQLIASLFILAFFLGFIYEREKTLWAPIALHMSFNAFSVLMIVLG
jgi:membrane protease YdiL (CAAX protease family)